MRGLTDDMAEITVKAESTFYAELAQCPPDLLASTPGLRLEKRGLSTFLVITDAVLDRSALFGRYLADGRARCVFGAKHPLYERAAVQYAGSRPARIAHFCTRLLLAFVEVQLTLGFDGSSFVTHQRALERVLANQGADLIINYYDPFGHRDNVGIHYVLGREGRGSGYDRSDWDLFVSYSQRVMERAFELDPAAFGSEEGLTRAKSQFPQYVADAHARDGSILIALIRHWSRVIDGIMARQAPEQRVIRLSGAREPVPYIPFVDCLLDMPYKQDALIVFQSVCGSR